MLPVTNSRPCEQNTAMDPYLGPGNVRRDPETETGLKTVATKAGDLRKSLDGVHMDEGFLSGFSEIRDTVLQIRLGRLCLLPLPISTISFSLRRLQDP